MPIAWLEHFSLSSCYNLKVLGLTFCFAQEHVNYWPHVPLFLSSITSTGVLTIAITFNRTTVDGIIDTGATICCISEAVWRDLGSPLYTDKATQMRDANGNVAGTLGAIVDQPIVIGGLTFYVTIQVVPNAPFSFILGTPFCAIASIDISYRPSSEMVIKVTDPNTDKSVLIPGSAKPRRTVAFIRPVESGKDF